MNEGREKPRPTYAAVYARGGRVYRMWFEAEDETAAMELAATWGAGVEGLADPPKFAGDPPPEAYNEKTARRLLGGISRGTLYNWITLGWIDRLAGTRRLLITRVSIERRCQDQR